MPNEFKAIPVKPMVGVFDTLSSTDEIGFGNWRIVKNAVTRSTRNRQRGGGWRRLFADDESYNNQDLHDQLTNRLSYYDSFAGHAMGGGDLSGYGYPYFSPSNVIPEHDIFGPARGPYCGVYYPDLYPNEGLYAGCPVIYPFVGYPYNLIPAAISLTGLTAHWRFDSNYQDIISGLNFFNFGASLESGLLGNAAAFHGSDWIEQNTAAALEMGAEVKFGFTGWIKRFSDGVGQETVISKFGAAPVREYRLIITGGQLRFEVSNNGTAVVGVTNPASITSGLWYFFAFWHDPVLNTINIKVNDGATVSASHTTGVYALSGSGLKLSFSDELSASTLDGMVDSLSLWKTAFPSSADLSALYHTGMGIDYPFSTPGCNTGSPGFYLQSFVYVSCPTHYDPVLVPGYGYGPRFPIYSSEFAYDYIYCGGYLYHRTGCREAVTMLGEIVTSTGRKLIAGTMSRVYEYNQSAGNWRILADGLGNAGYTGDQCGCNSVRGSMATMGIYMLYTNTFDYPLIYALGERQDNCQQHDLVPISDLVALGITRAGGVVVWKGFAIFFDVTEAGTRLGGTFLWSDIDDPTSYIESDTSHAGRKTVAVGQTILAMAPLGNWLMCYTDKGIYRITLVGGENVFNIEEIKGVGGNALKFKYSLMVSGGAHMWVGDSDVMYFTQFDTAPIHVPWITRAAGMIFKGIEEDDASYGEINRDACNLVTGGWNEDTREAWLSWPTGDNVCPNVTLRFNLKYNTADFVDHGFTSFLTFKADLRPTVGQWMEDMGICARATLVATGPKDGPPCSEVQTAVPNPPLYIRNPQESADFPIHPQSLCARLAGLSMDDFCVDCAAPATFIAASASDFALKQAEDDYYFREILAGNIEDYDAYSCTGQYYTQVGYDTVMQTGNEAYRTTDQKLVKRVVVDAEPLPQSTPSRLEAAVAFGEQSKCMVWKEIRDLPYECRSALSVAEQSAQKIRPDLGFKFPTWRRGKFLASRFRIRGIGGGGTFSMLANVIRGWGQQDSP